MVVARLKSENNMTTTEKDPSGLGEIRLKPEEKKYSPFNVFTEKIPDTIITGCEEVQFPPFNALTSDSSTISFQVSPL